MGFMGFFSLAHLFYQIFGAQAERNQGARISESARAFCDFYREGGDSAPEG
jgi:hypothetical protein